MNEPRRKSYSIVRNFVQQSLSLPIDEKNMKKRENTAKIMGKVFNEEANERIAETKNLLSTRRCS